MGHDTALHCVQGEVNTKILPITAVSSSLKLRYALFWDITWRRMLIMYRRFGTTYPSHLQDGIDWLSLNVGTELSLYAA
jgi:hypothetical protein